MKHYQEGNLTKEELILAKVRELGISENFTEQQLWKQGYQFSGIHQPVEKQTKLVVAERLFQTLDLMSQSANPYFKSAYSFISGLEKQERFEFVFNDQLGPDELTLRSTNVTDKSGNPILRYLLYISPEFILNRSSSLTFAGALTHEIKHTQQFESYLNSLPSNLTPDEKTIQLQTFDKQFLLEHESEAYATDVQAYIYQAGLMGGLYDEQLTRQDDRAARYILSGYDWQKSEWQNYVQNVLMSPDRKFNK